MSHAGSTPARRSAPATVEAWLAALDHPFKAEILALRQVILGADPRITESVKWNAPSFRTAEYFATFHLRAHDGVRVILHLGAKPRDGAQLQIADPAGLLAWLGPDRASATFRSLDEVVAQRDAFEQIIRLWITYV